MPIVISLFYAKLIIGSSNNLRYDFYEKCPVLLENHINKYHDPAHISSNHDKGELMGTNERRSGNDRRSGGDRRIFINPNHKGPERRRRPNRRYWINYRVYS